MLAAGNLRERIEIYRAETSQAATGEQQQEWRLIASVRAQVIQQKSSKALTLGENWYPTARSFRLRIPPELRGGDRIKYRGELYVALPPKIFIREGVQEVDCELYNE